MLRTLFHRTTLCMAILLCNLWARGATPAEALARARELQNNGKLEEALRAFDEAVPLNPKSAVAYFWRAEVKARLSKHREAIEDFGTAERLKADGDGPPMRRAFSHLALKDKDSAFDDFSAALKVNPKLAEAWYERGNIQYGRWKLREAIEDFSQAIRLRSNYPEALHQRAWAHFWARESEKALEDFSTAIELNPKSAQIWYDRGIAREGFGLSEAAIADLSEAIRLSPNYHGPLHDRGHAYMELGKFEEAVRDFSAAIASNPDIAKPYADRGWCYFSLQRPAQAIKDYDKAIRLEPTNAWHYVNRGRSYATASNSEKALKDFALAIEKDPSLAEPYVYRGSVRMEGGHAEAALADLNKAIHLNTKLPFAYRARAYLFQEMGKTSEALADETMRIKLDPKNFEAWQERGALRSEVRDFTGATADFHKALDLNSASPEAHEGRLFANLNRGRAEHVATDAAAWFKAKGWWDGRSPYIAIFACLAHRAAKNPGAARQILDDAMTKGDTAKWPTPMIRHLRGDLSLDELLKQATNNDQQTEARAYAGLDLLFKGQRDEARKHLLWVKEHGNKTFTEYILATEWLARREGSAEKWP